MDYQAWTSSKNKLKKIFGPKSNRPNDVASIDQNLKDLQQHFDEHQKKIAFTYTILNEQKDRCVGYLYIRRSSSPFFDFGSLRSLLFLVEIFLGLSGMLFPVVLYLI